MTEKIFNTDSLGEVFDEVTDFVNEEEMIYIIDMHSTYQESSKKYLTRIYYRKLDNV